MFKCYIKFTLIDLVKHLNEKYKHLNVLLEDKNDKIKEWLNHQEINYYEIETINKTEEEIIEEIWNIFKGNL